MNKLNQKGIAPLIIIAIVAAGMIGATGTAVASNGSKPGDALYGIDKALERVQLALSFTSGMKQNARLAIADERLKEIQDLLKEISIDYDAIKKLKEDVKGEINKIKDLSDDDSIKSITDLEDRVKDLEDESKDIDKAAEATQKALEDKREQLKKEYEAALKSGDTTKASSLQQQINSMESQLKTNEQQRETEKKALEQQAEAEKKAQELQKETVEKEAEKEDESEDR